MPWHIGADHVLTSGTQQIQLTPIEARALAYLLAREGQVVERRALEVEVWGYREGVVSEAVPVAMRQLRRKLGTLGSRLHTVRAVGWRLDAPSLFDQLQTLPESVDRDGVHAFRSMLPAALAEVQEMPTDQVDKAAQLLVPLVAVLAPDQLQRATHAFLRRRPASLVVRLVSARHTQDVDGIALGLAHSDPEVRLLAVRAQRLIRPAEVSEPFLRSLRPELTGRHRLELDGIWMAWRLAHLDPQAMDELDELLESARPYRLLRHELLTLFGTGLFRTRAFRRAVVLLDAAVADAEELDLEATAPRRIRALARVHLPRCAASAELLSVAVELDAAGRAKEAQEARAYGALVEAGAGRWEPMAAALKGAGGSPSIARIADELRVLDAAAQGDTASLEALAACSSTAFVQAGEHELFATFLASWFRTVAGVLLGTATWHDVAALDGAGANPEAELLLVLAAARAEAEGP